MEKKGRIIYEIIKWILAFLSVLTSAVLGAIYNNSGIDNKTILIVLLIALPLILIIGTVASLVAKNRFVKKIDRENLQRDLLAQRDRGESIANEKIALLKKLIKTIDGLSILFLILVCISEFCFIAICGAEAAGAALPAIMGAYCGLYFIRPRKIKINENKSEDYLKEEEYPLIYALTRRAADLVGCGGKIKIFVDHDFNAGVMAISGGYSIRLGSYILDNMSEEELFNVMLHEFAHVEKKNDEINGILTYFNLVQDDQTLNFAVCPYIYFHAKFMFEFFAYQYICSLMNEDAADLAMRSYGNPEVAASMLIKLKFSELYQWERNTYDEENIFEPEEMIEDCIRRPLRWFRERMEIRKEEWIKMIDSEILSRSATHSTAKMRIESLGVKEARLLPKSDSEEYLRETDKAISHLEALVRKDLQKSYSEIRESEYLQHKRVIEEWESAGKPITRENYQNIIIAHFASLKISDFVNLCCQVIEEIPEPANYFAHHMYGIYLLRCYDERGLDHLYKSIELNHNEWEEAMQTIGQYSCMVGKQDELDKYRARAMEMSKKHINLYEKMDSIGPKDTLIRERELPRQLMAEMLEYFKEIDNGTIESIHMVRKVIDRDNFVTCIVVMPKKKADMNKFSDAMSRIFQFLDKSSDWQFALFDMRFVPKKLVLKVEDSYIYKGRA